MDAARPDQKRLSPASVENRNIGGEGNNRCRKAVQADEFHRRDANNFYQLRSIVYGLSERFADGRWIANQEHKNLSLRRIWYHIRRPASGNRSYVHRAAAQNRILRKWDVANRCKSIQQCLDCRFS